VNSQQDFTAEMVFLLSDKQAKALNSHQ